MKGRKEERERRRIDENELKISKANLSAKI